MAPSGEAAYGGEAGRDLTKDGGALYFTVGTAALWGARTERMPAGVWARRSRSRSCLTCSRLFTTSGGEEGSGEAPAGGLHQLPSPPVGCSGVCLRPETAGDETCKPRPGRPTNFSGGVVRRNMDTCVESAPIGRAGRDFLICPGQRRSLLRAAPCLCGECKWRSRPGRPPDGLRPPTG